MRKLCLVSFAFLFVVACGDNENNPTCGDGHVDPGEVCDDGNTVNGDGCDLNCTATACGNGVLTVNEGCDDGNSVNGDGCDTNCMVTGCGNGVVSTGEGCDDGNTVSGDGCDNNCTPTACGNGVMTGNEVCDDGNTVNDDGCDSNCTVTACGNGVMSGTEQCDDGNTVDFDGCSAACATETLEKEPNEDGTISTGASGITGNDFAIANADTNGAYDANVTIIAKIDPAGDEDVFKFTNSGTVGTTVRFDTWNLETGFGIGVPCGATSMSLDTGINIRNATGTVLKSNNDRNGTTDWCSGLTYPLLPGDTIYVHVVEYGDNTMTGHYALQAMYTPSVCGDGMITAGEQCDDSNTTAGDGCSATCQVEGTPEMEPNEDGTPSLGGSGINGNDFGSTFPDANGAFTANSVILASLMPAGDEDVFKFSNTTTTPQVVQFDVWNLAPGFGLGVACGSSIDTAMHVRDAAGTSLASNDDRNGASDRCSTLQYVIQPGASIYVHVTDYGDNTAIPSYALQAVYTPVPCGDGIMGPGEQCDDGNMVNGDGCSSTCQIEIICGDGMVGGTEQCDDGNTTSGDGCSSTCQIEIICGDGTIEGTEQCDDGNTVSGDGCSSTCTIEIVCGDGTVAGTEQCDDGNTMNGDGCSSTCQIEGAVNEIEPNEDGTPSTGGTGTSGNDFGSTFPDANGAFTGSSVIVASINPVGDEDVFKFSNTGTTPAVVRFDIYNLANGFGIGVACGTSIDTALQIRTATGTSLASNDDRNGSADRCSGLNYTLPAGQSVYAHVISYDDADLINSYALKVVYTPVVCGDGNVGPGEQCDDGNTMNGDGCNSTCQLEFVCGDGVRGGTEQCDDGNLISGDGCSSTCQVEAVTEVEPNDTTTQAMTSTVQVIGDVSLQGSIGAVGDKDVYQVVVATATVVRFEALTSFYDCASGTAIDLRLFDMNGTQILADTSGQGIGSCGEISMYLAAGTYFIQAEEHLNDATVANYYLQVDYNADTGMESEPNDTNATADTNLVGVSSPFVFGDHSVSTDSDVYAITVPPGARIRAEIIEGDRAVETCESNGIDSRLLLFDQNGTQLVNDDDGGRGFCSLIDGTGTTPQYTAARNSSATAQTFYIAVRSSGTSTSAANQFIYRLLVTFR